MSKTNSGLIAYCKAQVGLPYWYGTFGQTASEALYKAKKSQYPEYYTASDFKSQFGKRVHDCAGLIKGYLWSDSPTSPPKYNPSSDYGATGFYNAAEKKGTISSFPRVNGMLVFRGNDSVKKHVGVYCDGKVYEAKGHAYGVVISTFSTDNWGYWAQCHLLLEDTSSNPQPSPTPAPSEKKVTIELPMLREGSKGNEVKSYQMLLRGYGYTDINGTLIEVDGEFGPKTKYATRILQENHHIEVDGIVGVNTWNVILKNASSFGNTKSIEEVAKEVIQGKWDDYPERKRLLEAAGYNYSEVQSLVNKILKGG